jgi:Mg2+ and Co2+ transporter CorA
MLLPNNAELKPLVELRGDFLIIQQDLEAMQALFQNQIMSIVSTVGAITSLQENQRAMQQNRDITRLTYLAVVFVPMAFVSSLLSMTPNVKDLADTFRLYFILALPLSFLALSVVQWGYLKKWIFDSLGKFHFTRT